MFEGIFSVQTLSAGLRRGAWALLFAAVLSGCERPPPPAPPRYPEVDVDMKLQQVSPHVYFVQGKAGAATQHKGFISNAGVIITPEGIVVFDALGSPSLAQKLVGLIRQESQAPFHAVVLSHYHADHIYGLQVFKERGAKIIAPKGANVYLSSDTAETLLESRRKQLAPWVNERTHLVPPDQIIDGDYSFSLGGVRLQLSYVGNAHSDGDLTLFVEPDNVLFSGDIIFEGRVPFVGSANTRNWLATLERMERAKVNALIPGHGAMARDPAKAVGLTRRYLALLRSRMKQAVENWEAFDEAYDKIDWGEFELLPAFFEANRRNAYNVYLSLEKEMLLGEGQ